MIRGRGMHWIRVDRYFSGKPDDAEGRPSSRWRASSARTRRASRCARWPPPCTATEGLNEQVYNRCVGTRYCSNNCPYKVRRFNFFNYFKNVPQSEKMVFNPEVTVRGRGVMEKCTLLHPAHRGGEDRRQERPPADPRRRDRPGVRPDLPDPGDRVRRHQGRRRAASRGCGRPTGRTRCWGSSTRSRARPTSPSCATPPPRSRKVDERGALPPRQHDRGPGHARPARPRRQRLRLGHREGVRDRRAAEAAALAGTSAFAVSSAFTALLLALSGTCSSSASGSGA